MSILQLAIALLEDMNQVSRGTVSSRVPWDTSKKPPAGQCGQLGRLGHSGRPGRDEWNATDWRAYFDERAAIAEFDGGMARQDAERMALDHCVTEWLNRNPARSDPGRCRGCGENGGRAPLLAYGGGDAHTWLHGSCWPAWYDSRQKRAAAALREMGVGPAGEGAIDG